MKKTIRNWNGWDISVEGKKFNDRFKVTCIPNMLYIHKAIQEFLYNHIASKFAAKHKLSIESEKEADIVRSWTDERIEEFIEDISSMEVSSKHDYPLSLFTSLEQRMDIVLERVKEEMKETSPLAYYSVLQDDERFGYRTKI